MSDRGCHLRRYYLLSVFNCVVHVVLLEGISNITHYFREWLVWVGGCRWLLVQETTRLRGALIEERIRWICKPNRIWGVELTAFGVQTLDRYTLWGLVHQVIYFVVNIQSLISITLEATCHVHEFGVLVLVELMHMILLDRLKWTFGFDVVDIRTPPNLSHLRLWALGLHEVRIGLLLNWGSVTLLCLHYHFRLVQVWCDRTSLYLCWFEIEKRNVVKLVRRFCQLCKLDVLLLVFHLFKGFLTRSLQLKLFIGVLPIEPIETSKLRLGRCFHRKIKAYMGLSACLDFIDIN